MDSAQRVNPAVALYSAAVAILAYGIASATLLNLGGEGMIGFVAMLVALVAIVAASIAMATGFNAFTPVWTIVATAGTLIALDAGLAAGVSVLNFPSNDSEYSTTGGFVFYGIVCVIAIVIAGFAGVRAVSACRQYFGSINPYVMLISAIAINAVVVTFCTMSSGIHPDQDYQISGNPPRIQVIAVDGGVLYGLGGDIGLAAGLIAILVNLIPVTVIVVLVFAGTVALRRRYSNDGIDRMILTTAVGVAVIVAIIAGLVTAIGVISGVADAKVHHANWGRELDVASAIVASIVALLGCAVVAGLAGVVAWWFQSLRGRRQI